MSDTGALLVVPPPPGQRRLERRLGHFDDFARDLVLHIEQRRGADGEPLAHRWDVEGDPSASLLVRLWAFVAEGVAAYSELTAGEGFLGTAADWTDLRRLSALVGYRPRGRVAAQGWVRAEVEPDSNPVVPAGTRVQAPAGPTSGAQTFEAVADTQLLSEWEGLSATWPLASGVPDGATIRFPSLVAFDVGDTVLFVAQDNTATGVPVLTAQVIAREDEIGTSRVTFDRNVGKPLKEKTDVFAHRVVAQAGPGRRLTSVLTVVGGTAKAVPITYPKTQDPVGKNLIILDALLEELAAGRHVALAFWQAQTLAFGTVSAHAPVQWAVAPGTTTQASRAAVAYKAPAAVEKLLKQAKRVSGGALTFYVLEGRTSAQHRELRQTPPSPARLRLFPGPQRVPPYLAVETLAADGSTAWEVVGCSLAPGQAASGRDPGQPVLVDIDRPLVGTLVQTRASGNLFRVRHGTSAAAVLGSGDTTQPGQLFRLPDAPLAHDLDLSGAPVSSLVLRADGVRWDERETLYRAGSARAFRTLLAADGGATIEVGAGPYGARLPTGRGNVTAEYRVGGGTQGEVESGAIATLLGSVRGVQKVAGAGPTSGGADQDDERLIRSLAPASARAFGRVVSLEDAVDLAVSSPGVSHAAGWIGAGKTGCPCGGRGGHLVFARTGVDGPRRPTSDEVESMRRYLDARRDPTVPLCVFGADVSLLALTVTLAVDPARVPAAVAAAAAAALSDTDNAVAPAQRRLGEALDPSDVYGVLHAVPGVLGVVAMTLGGLAVTHLDRHPAQRHELLLLAPSPAIMGAAR